MTWYVAIYETLVYSAVAGFAVLAVAAAALAAIRQPARRIRVIQAVLVGLLALPLLPLVPGYPRIAILPATQPVADVEQELEPTEALPPEPVVPDRAMVIPAAPTPDIAEDPPVAVPPLEETPPPAPAADSSTATLPVSAAPAKPAWQLPRDYRLWVAIAYLAGTGAMIAWSLLGLVAVGRLLWSARQASDECLAVLRDVAGPASARVWLVASRHARQPCLLLWWRPTIVLPQTLAEGGRSRQLRFALAHEWSHVARGDVWTWGLSSVVRWFYFYQPLLWLLRRQLRLCQDYLADAAGAAGSSEDYAEFLTAYSSHLRHPSMAAGLGIAGRPSELQRRVVMLLDPRRPLERRVPRLWNLAVVPLAALLLAAVTCVRAEPGDASPKADKRGAERAGNADSKQTAPTPISDVFVEAEVENDPIVQQLTQQLFALRAQDTKRSTPEATADDERRTRQRILRLEELIDERKAELRPRVLELLAERGQPRTRDENPGRTVTAMLAELPADPIIYRLMDQRQNLASDLEKLQTPLPNGQDNPATKALKRKIQKLDELIDERKRELRPQLVGEMPFSGHIRPGDILKINLVGGFPGGGPERATVEPDGNVPLGAHFGRVHVAGMTLIEAEDAVRKTLSEFLRNPQVQLTYVGRDSGVEGAGSSPRPATKKADDTVAAPPFSGRIRSGDILSIDSAAAGPRQATVEPDGNLPLGVQYGRVQVRGKTLEEAEAVVKEHLSEILADPVVQLTYVGHDSGVVASDAPHEAAPKPATPPKPPFEPVRRPQRPTAPRSPAPTPPLEPASPLPAATPADDSVPLPPSEAARPARKVSDLFNVVPPSEAAPRAADVSDPIKAVPQKTGPIDTPAVRPDEPLQPLDTIEIRVPLRPQIQRVTIDGETREVFTFNMPNFNGTYVIEPNGDIALGHDFGRVNSKGMDVRQAGTAIRARLAEKLHTRTALPAVHVFKRGRAVFLDGREPPADYRVRPGDSLLIGQVTAGSSNRDVLFNYLVDADGNVGDKRKVKVAGMTLSEVEEALQEGWKQASPAAEQPVAVPWYVTIGGWREQADPEVIDRLEGSDQTRIQRLERELEEIKQLIREQK